MIWKIALALLAVAAIGGLVLWTQFTTVRIRSDVDLPPTGFSHDRLARVLDRFVDDEGRVDYPALAADRADLEAYLSLLARTSPTDDPARFPSAADRLAYYINAYNAFVLYGVTQLGASVASVYDVKIRFFGLTRYALGKKAVSLHSLENDIVRPLGEPRIHFALNCASAGCPRLPRTPFLPQTLEAQLDRETRAFCADRSKVRLAEGKAQLSQIFEWYADDFEPGGPVALCRAAGRSDLPADAPVEFIPYDWTMNRQPRASNRVR